MPTPKHVQQELRVIGMRRTGNHAIINWILQQAQGTQVFLNAVAPNDPFHTVSPDSQGKLTDHEAIDWLIFSMEDELLNYIKRPRILKKRLL